MIWEARKLKGYAMSHAFAEFVIGAARGTNIKEVDGVLVRQEKVSIQALIFRANLVE